MRLTLFIIAVFVVGCSSIKMTHTTGYTPTRDQSDDSVSVLTQFDSVPRAAILIGSFRMIENKNGAWKFSVYPKLKDFAISHKANMIKIDAYHMNGGMGTRGNLGLVDGRLYFSGSTIPQPTPIHDSLHLFVFRYEKDDLLPKAFNFKLYSNDSLLGTLPNRSTYKVPVKLGNEIVLSTDNNIDRFSVRIKKSENYYVVVFKRARNASPLPGTFMLDVGDVVFVPYDPIIGKLEYENILQLNREKALRTK